MRKVLVLFSFLLSSQALATWIIEPLGGYEFGTLNLEGSGGPTKWAVKPEGFIMGARGAYEFDMGAIVGLEYDYVYSGTLKGDVQVGSVPGNVDDRFQRTMIYLLGGYRFNNWFSAWGGYALMNTFVWQPAAGANRTLQGDSWRVGVGINVHKFVSLNFDFHFPILKTQDGSDIRSQYDQKVQEYIYMVSVSVPLRFGEPKKSAPLKSELAAPQEEMMTPQQAPAAKPAPTRSRSNGQSGQSQQPQVKKKKPAVPVEDQEF